MNKVPCPPLSKPALRHWLACLLLVVGCLYIYQGILDTGFVMFDDDVNFVYNERLGPLSWDRLGWIAGEHAVMVRYVPVGWIFCSALLSINGMDPFWFHAASLALHAGSCVLLYVLLKRLGPRLGIQDMDTPVGRLAGLLPLLLAAWWGWHPLRVETVAWATPMIYVLSTFVGLLSLLLLLRWAETKALGKAQGWTMAGAITLYITALLSHPAALSFIPMFGVVIALILPPKGGLRNLLKDRAWQKMTAKCVAPFVVAGVAMLAVTMIVRQMPTLVPRTGTPSIEQFGVLQRFAQGSAVLLHFFEKTLWPGKLNPAYPLLYQVIPSAPFFILSMIASCGLMGVLLLTLWRRLKAGMLGFAALVACLPVLGLNETPYYPCDRYTYIPSILLAFFILSVAGQNVVSRRLCVRVGIPLLAAVLPVWILVAQRQTKIWSSTYVLYDEIAAIQPAGEGRSHFLCRKIAEKIDEGKIDEARRMLINICEAMPMDANIRAISGHLNTIEKDKGPASYALLLNTQARVALKAADKELAIERLHRALAFSPNYEEARFNLGLLLAMSGEAQESLAHFLWLKRQGRSLSTEKFQMLKTAVAGALRRRGQDRLAEKLEANF